MREWNFKGSFEGVFSILLHFIRNNSSSTASDRLWRGRSLLSSAAMRWNILPFLKGPRVVLPLTGTYVSFAVLGAVV
jgi:hypothetical protein